MLKVCRFDRSPLDPQHPRQLLAPLAYREPPRITNGTEAVAAQVDGFCMSVRIECKRLQDPTASNGPHRRAALDCFRFEYADADDAAGQAPSIAWAVSAWSSIAAQLARRFSASSNLERGSAV